MYLCVCVCVCMCVCVCVCVLNVGVLTLDGNGWLYKCLFVYVFVCGVQHQLSMVVQG